MRCPLCGSLDNRVVDSRTARNGYAIRRRRACEACSERFTTYEEIEEIRPDVVKKRGTTEPFDRDKLLRSLRLACNKRPIELDELTVFIDTLECRLDALPRRAVPSSELGDLVLDFLHDRDPVAYVRYASVYRSFGSVDEFMAELRRIQSEGTRPPAASAPSSDESITNPA